jgi:diguanylate cyclase
MNDDIQSLKELVKAEGELPVEEIESGIRKIKDIIIAGGNGDGSGDPESDYLHGLESKLTEACRTIKRILTAILDDFYPMTDEMIETAEKIGIECKGDITQIELKAPSEDLLNFLQRIKIKISEDFKDINAVFLVLLDQVKEIEKTISTEFDGERTLKEVEYFEMKINKEVGSIAESFNVQATINEVKKVVLNKLERIKSLVTKKKNEEIERNQIARASIAKLTKRINEVENRAQQMSEKAALFQEAAMKDGPTGLFSRSAFDHKVGEALGAFIEKGTKFSIILFDVDKLKSINDILGHVAGDKVLKKVAECLMETFRKNDFIARYGGDEFVVIIDGFTEKMVLDRVSVFNENLKKRRFVSYKEGEISLTVSAGTTEVQEGDTPESIIERADKAMYASKQRGDL